MPVHIDDPELEARLIAQRQAAGGDRYDEVWEGTYIMSPLADIEHQMIQSALVRAIGTVTSPDTIVLAGTNVSDRQDDWEYNYRCPDVAVFLPGTSAKDCGTHWFGGPDFATEILSRHDRSRQKFDFYTKINIRELLLIDRRPWALELYRHDGRTFAPAGRAISDGGSVQSSLFPLTFSLAPAAPRPRILIARADGSQRWSV